MKENITFALVIPKYKDMFNTFSAVEIMKGAKDASFSHKVDLLVHIGQKDNSVAPRIFDLDFIKGIIFVDFFGNEKLIPIARRKKIPFIIVNYFNKTSPDNCIGIDNQKASMEAIDYLVKSGHKKIATITGKLKAQCGMDRLIGYKRGLKKHKISIDPKYIVLADWSEESGKKAMKKLIALKDRPTAVFVAGDEMAIGALKIAKESNLRFPEDISIVGFDNIPQGNFPEVSLTTIDQHQYILGIKGIEYLKKIVEKKVKQPIKLFLENTELVKRNSA
ncbi:MAG: substrate-binding domain-containing protein [Candidatus Omnitrophota bacterium]